MKKLIYFVTEDWYFLSHRLPMARAAMSAGFDVSLITNIGASRAAIETAGIRVIAFPLQRKSLNPFVALKQIFALTRIYTDEKPDLVHHIALKPILFGSIAATLANVPRVVNAFAGLGVIFETNVPVALILRPLLVVLFSLTMKRRNFWTLFQNRDDRDRMIALKIADPERSVIIRGSGVDVDAYAVTPLPPAPPVICVMAGRMIAAKGLEALQGAFEILRRQDTRIQLWLCGQPDPANPGSWNAARLQQWSRDNPNVIWKGQQTDMQSIWAQAHIALQPSLGGEGLPKSLLEAGACGRPMIVSDVPGCREVVEEGRNGHLVQPGDALALSEKILKLAGDLPACAEMGLESRKIVEGDLSAAAVMAQTQMLYMRIMN
ncbi:MAG: Lipid carrier : UDP-N-acetylgalactosaminyltransferase / Alpha,3-N-acetylgalactosamine transferase [Micavibrio sp.]|nr:Lipid carrier : UDP-N-acetylgalactosaminyltransferase / Alpha,3-N-acetylgalactosamine transferase [Micavibrio sp.]